MTREELNRTFAKLIGEVGLEGRGARAAPETARSQAHAGGAHTAWTGMQAGEDIDRRMPLLSTFLGHVDPASDVLVSARRCPELLALISRRLERLPEVLS